MHIPARQTNTNQQSNCCHQQKTSESESIKTLKFHEQFFV